MIAVPPAKIKEAAMHSSSDGPYRSIFIHNPVPMWVYDTATLLFLEVNEAAIELYGFSRDEFLQMTLLQICTTTETGQIELLKNGLHKQEKTARSVWCHQKKNKDILQADLSVQAVVFDGKEAALVIINDVTEKVEMEARNARISVRAKAAQQIAKLGYWEYNITSGEWFLSDQTYQILGWDKKNTPINYDSFVALIHPDDRKYYADKQAEVLVEKKSIDAECRIVLKNGAVKNISGRAALLFDEAGNTNIIEGIIQDITEQKKAEEQLRISNERYLFATKATSDAIWDWDLVNDHLYWGEGYEKIFGYPVSANQDNHIYSFNHIHPEDRGGVFAGIDHLVNGTGENWTGEYRYKKLNGEYVIVYDKAIVIRNDEGKAIRMIGAMQDITERKKAEEIIQSSREKFNSLVNTIDGIVWEADASSFQFTYVSDHAEKLLGYLPDHWMQEKDFWVDHIHPEDKLWVTNLCHHQSKEQNQFQFEYRMLTSDGRTIWLADFVTVVNEPSMPTRLRGIMVDITARKKAEEELVKERKLLRVLIDNLPDYIYVKDLQRNHIINNKANVTLLGYKSEKETIGRTIADMIGEEKARAFMQDDQFVLSSGKAVIDREEPIQSENNEQRWLLTTKIPLKDEKDGIIGLVGISRDITERRKAEEELKEKNIQLKELSRHLQNVREAERKHLAREVHDELGQLASVVKMDIDWLAIKIGETQVPYQNRLTHASSTIQLMITTIRKIASELRPGMLDELGLNASLEWRCTRFSVSNQMECNFYSTVDDTKLDATVQTELFRICQESLTNVMRHANATEVTVSLNDLGETIELVVADNGLGFDINAKKGTLGLIGMRERCITIDGKLVIESEPGKGTTIRAIIKQ